MNEFFNRENCAVTTPPTPPSQGGEKRRNEIVMNAQLVQDRLSIAPAARWAVSGLTEFAQRFRAGGRAPIRPAKESGWERLGRFISGAGHWLELRAYPLRGEGLGEFG